MTHSMDSYGCVKCQCTHFAAQPISQQHLFFQSTHGISRQPILQPVNWQLTDPNMPLPGAPPSSP